ncbi:hypothetical protein H0274_06560 [Altererythrobacter sp. CC-YST694]|uniref:hypothetical protein n=1 Tax=Altererythrobacter sp. CC-YST694 TaxID=2755038 RepID=UPI001D018C8C|nr:hypothetical protein [Altererythrobacter sp. CC-YST694]MCB5424910.1 hypothetical protein [Altererythrobacter sp. CC-YST694]
MASFRFRADDIPGIGVEHDAGDVVIVAHRDDGDVLELAFASEEIPHLSLSLTVALAALSNGISVAESRIPLLIDSVGIAGSCPSLALETTLSTGLPVTFSLPEALARDLRDKLNSALGDG